MDCGAIRSFRSLPSRFAPVSFGDAGSAYPARRLSGQSAPGIVATHVLTRGIAHRLPVPGCVTTDRQGGVKELSAPLTLDHAILQGRWIPPATDFAGKIGLDVGDLRSPGEVDEFVGILRDVEEHGWIILAMDVLPAIAANHQHRRGGALAAELAADDVRPAVTVSRSQSGDAGAVDRREEFRQLAVAGPFQEGREKIEQGHVLCDPARGIELRRMDDQRYAHRPLEEVHLQPQAAFAKHVPVIGRHDDDRVVVCVDGLEGLQDPPDAIIEPAHYGIVRAPRPADVRRTDRQHVAADRVVQSAAVGVTLFEWDVANPGIVDAIVRVEIPVRRWRQVGVVRADETGRQEEGSAVGPVGVIVEPAAGLDGCLLIVVRVDAAPPGPRIEHGPHRVEPRFPEGRTRRPVAGPREVGGIDVGRHPVLETVKLVRADEVHLAGEARVIAHCTKIVREGRDFGWKFRCVVIRSNAAGHAS